MTLSLAVTVGALFGAGVGGVGWWLAERYQKQPAHGVSVSEYARWLRPILKDKLGVGDSIEYDMRGDKEAMTRLATYEKRIEDWRTDVSHFLSSKLPDSGADVKFLTFRPRVGQGGLLYEYERLNEMRANLVHIIDNLESYCARSSDLPHGVGSLVKLRTHGVALRNRQVRNEKEWIAFHHEFEEWQKAVIIEMRSVGVADGDIGWFQVLDQVPVMTFSHTYSGLHEKDLRELSEKLKRLQEIIHRHEQQR